VNDQLTLFTTEAQPAPKAARAVSSPAETRRAAGGEIAGVRTELQRRVLRLIRERGPRGATDHEIAKALAMLPDTVRARRVELRDLGAIAPSGRTRPTPSGRQATVWTLCGDGDDRQAAEAPADTGGGAASTVGAVSAEKTEPGSAGPGQGPGLGGARAAERSAGGSTRPTGRTVEGGATVRPPVAGRASGPAVPIGEKLSWPGEAAAFVLGLCEEDFPATPFELSPGVEILDAARFLGALQGQTRLGLRAPEARNGALQKKLRGVYRLLTGEEAPGVEVRKPR